MAAHYLLCLCIATSNKSLCALLFRSLIPLPAIRCMPACSEAFFLMALCYFHHQLLWPCIFGRRFFWRGWRKQVLICNSEYFNKFITIHRIAGLSFGAKHCVERIAFTQKIGLCSHRHSHLASYTVLMSHETWCKSFSNISLSSNQWIKLQLKFGHLWLPHRLFGCHCKQSVHRNIICTFNSTWNHCVPS